MQTNPNYETILLFSVRLGEVMLKSGAETYRVEDTITRILNAHGFKYADTFVTPTVIMATIKENDHAICSTLRRIKNRQTRLDKIERINQLSRDYVLGHIDLDKAQALVENIDQLPAHSPRLIELTTGLCSGFFCLMFDGGIAEFIISFLVGFGVAKLQHFMKKREIINYFSLFMASFFIGTCLTVLTFILPNTLHSEAITIGCIMPLVPGLAFTNAIRDMIGDELLSGISRGFEALFIAIAIAAGVGIPMSIGIYLGGL